MKKGQLIKAVNARYRSICKIHGIKPDTVIDTEMDLLCADREFNMDWERLYSADDFNFMHDINGIKNHIVRKGDGYFKGFFEPRCQKKRKAVAS